MAVEDYKVVAQKKSEANRAKIPKEWQLQPKYLQNVNPQSQLSVLDVPRKSGILSEKEIDITENHDATALLEKLASKQLSSYEVVLAFCKRAAIAQQLVNCLTEMFFDEAISLAKECDEYLEKHGKPIGPLHGLPISLKDSFNVKGQHTTIGYVSFASKPPSSINSALVEIIQGAGAVPYVKTNIPLTMMTADSENNLFGRTLNPNKLSLTAGGSTGGEGALLKLRGSILGVGTDIAGSVRIPALCDGVFGFKPTAGRIPFAGKVPPGRLGSPGPILPVIGPEGHSIRDLELFVRTVIDAEPWELDEGVLAVPWRRIQAPTRKLRLGLLLETKQRPLHPPMLRTMKSAQEQLEKAGHSVVDITGQVPSLWDAAILSWKLFLLDPKKTSLQHMQAAGEPFTESMKTCSFEEMAGYSADLEQLWDLNVERRKLMKHFHDILVQNKLDAFIMPPYQSTAQPHDLYGVVPYTVLANILDYPAASIPYLEANEKLDQIYIREDVKYEPAYDAQAIEGAPSGLQVVGRPMKDEELMQITSIITNLLSWKT